MFQKIKWSYSFLRKHPIASKRLFYTLGKTILWQFESTLFPKRQFIKSIAGNLKVYVQKGQTGITGNLYAGLHDFEEMGFLLHFLRTDKLFVDAGANVGSYTLLAAGISKCEVISFEPVPNTFKQLEANVKLNGLTAAIQLVNSGLAAENGRLYFSFDIDTTNHVVDEKAKNSVQVDVVTLDEILNGRCPSLLKLDVEGFEFEVLKGAVKTIGCPTLQAIIIELNGCCKRYGCENIEIHDFLVAAGFGPVKYHPFERKLIPIDTFGDANTLYIRDFEMINRKLQGASIVSVFGINF